MVEFKGTPGEWTLGEGWINKHISIDAPDHGAIALVLCDMEDDYTTNEKKRERKKEELAANANLIVGAKDLLAALQDAVAAYDKHGEKPEWDFAREAIAKALGEAK